jgi:hypothetical protein
MFELEGLIDMLVGWWMFLHHEPKPKTRIVNGYSTYPLEMINRDV